MKKTLVANGVEKLPQKESVWDLSVVDIFTANMRDSTQAELISAEEEKRLSKLILEDGNQPAKDALFLANTRWVISIAQRYQGRGVELVDLIQIGNIGLMKAVERFDYRRGFRFLTFATWWIRQAIQREIPNLAGNIRLPMHAFNVMRKVRVFIREYEYAHGHKPSTALLADWFDVSPEKIRNILKASTPMVPLDAPIGENGEVTRGSIIPDESPSPLDSFIVEEYKQIVKRLLREIDQRSRIVVEMRFGIGHPKEYTLEEIGDHLSLSKERVRQIESEALRLLKIQAKGDDIDL